MDKKRIIILILVLLLAIGGIIWYFVAQNNRGLTASGTIEATEVTVSSKVIGRVIEVKVDDGTKVSEGDVLAVIEGNELSQSLRGAQARYNLAKDDLARIRKLYNDGMASSQQYDAARSNFDIASSAMELAKIQYENAVIKAPISGTVLVKAVEKGELVTVGTPIATLANLSIVKLTVYLAEKDVGKVKLGQEVLVSVDSYPKEKFKGIIEYISEKAEFTPKAIQTKEERTTQVFGVKIRIPNPDSKLKPGMPADAGF